MWFLNLQTYKWSVVTQKGKIPCKRSGHRMVRFYSNIILDSC